MAQLKRSDVRLIENFVSYPNGIGYVIEHSDRTFSEFFSDEFKIEIYDLRYASRGTSKRHRLIGFCEVEHPVLVARVLRRLREQRLQVLKRRREAEPDAFDDEFVALISSLEGGADNPSTDALDRYIVERTLDELIADLERTIAANKPEAALDHLHTYCMKKFAHLLSERGIECGPSEPLNARFGKYRNALNAEKSLHGLSDHAMKNAVAMFEKFNDIRNNRSLAHDREILAHAEARYVYDVVCALLRFVKTLEAGRFEAIRAGSAS